MNHPIDWSRFHKDFPVTFVILVIIFGLFGAYHLGLIQPQLAFPGVIDYTTWSAHFFHSKIWHIVSNLIILIFMGILLERHLGPKLYALTIFLIWNILVFLMFWISTDPVYGFSGIGLGLLAYGTIYLRHDPHGYQLLLPLLIVNIAFGLFPGVSFWGHLLGAVAGFLTYGVEKLIFGPYLRY